MAKLEIDERAFSDPRLKKLSRLLGVPRHYAFGILVYIWHDSQEELKSHATGDEIDSWLDISAEQGELIRSMLQASNYLVLEDSGLLRIKGNKRRLAKIKKLRQRARDAAAARWDTKGKGKNSIVVPEMLDALHKEKPLASVKQCPDKEIKRERDIERERVFLNSADAQTTQSRQVEAKRPAVGIKVKATPAQNSGTGAITADLPLEKPKAAPKVVECVKMYISAFKQKFPNSGEPVLTGPEWAAAKNIVKALGTLDKVQSYIDGYFSIDDQYFLREMYPLRLLQTSSTLNKIQVKLSSGISVTSQVAKQVEKTSYNKEVAQAWLATRSKGATDAEW
jgi:hypothetical protein